MPISFKVMMPRAAEAGKIKIGQVVARKGSGKLPEKLESKEGPYFVITKTIRGTDPEKNFMRDVTLMKALEQHADLDSDGVKRLRQIPIMLDSDTIEQIAPTRLALYKGTNLFCAGTGDGKDAATRWEGDGTTQISRKVDCPCDFLRARGDMKCKPNLILWCTIVAGGETRLGVRHAFRTTGWNSIKSILADLETIQEQVGTLRGPRFWLCVKWDLKKDATGTTRRVPVVYVECRTNDLVALRREAIMTERSRLEVVQLRDPRVLALPAPAVNESKATQAEVSAEWYPRSDDDQHVSEDEDDDEAFYNPETGEVEDESQPEPQSRRGTDPALPTVEPVVYGTNNLDEVWLPTHAAQKRVAQLLRAVAKLRDLPAPEGKPAMKEVLAEVSTRVLERPILFNTLTLRQAMKIDDALVAEIQQRDAADAADAGDDDGIPE